MTRIWRIGISCWLLLLAMACATLLYQGRDKNEDGTRPVRVGAVFMTMNNPFFEVLNDEIEARVRQQGDVYYTLDGKMSQKKQNEQIQGLIDTGIDVLIVNAVDWIEVCPALKKVKEAGIKIIAVDTEIYDNELVDAFVVSDNYRAGALCAQSLMSYKREARVLLLVQSDNKSAIDRIKGFTETLDSMGWKYTIVDRIECEGQLEITEPKVEEWLKKGKDFDVVMALNDPSALGALAALDASDHYDGKIILGIDGSPDAKAMIQKGKMRITVAQFPIEIGKITGERIYQLMQGKEIERETVVPVKAISIKNLKEYNVFGWQ